MPKVEPTRLAFCITELDLGGAERALTQLAVNLNREEWEPRVYCLGPPGHFVETLQAEQIPVTCFHARGITSFPRVLWQLTRELRQFRPALLQSFLFHANLLGRMAARLAGVPVVVSGLRVADHRSRWYGRLDRWTNRLVATNVCVSQGVADFSERQVGLNPAKLVVIPNSVDVEQFASAVPADVSRFGIPTYSRVFISIGRLERQKGFDILLDAISQIPSLPEDVHFLIVGEGLDAALLRRHAAEIRWGSHIHFAGRQNNIPELLAASTALILSSRWEGMPNVVLEAMAAGLPIVATAVEGVAELVRDGLNGRVVDPEQPTELAVAIESLIADSTFAMNAGSESQEIVLQSFTTQITCDAYAQLYRRLLNK